MLTALGIHSCIQASDSPTVRLDLEASAVGLRPPRARSTSCRNTQREANGLLAEESQEGFQQSKASRTQQMVPCSVEAYDTILRRRSQSTPGRRLGSPTWQVPLQTNLAKATIAQMDEWKGVVKGKGYDTIGGLSKLTANCGEVSNTNLKDVDNDLDSGFGSDDGLKPWSGRSRGPRARQVSVYKKGEGWQPRQVPAACGIDAVSRREASVPQSQVKVMRRRARTLGPEGSRDRDYSSDRGTLRTSRRNFFAGPADGGAERELCGLGADPQEMGTSRVRGRARSHEARLSDQANHPRPGRGPTFGGPVMGPRAAWERSEGVPWAEVTTFRGRDQTLLHTWHVPARQRTPSTDGKRVESRAAKLKREVGLAHYRGSEALAGGRSAPDLADAAEELPEARQRTPSADSKRVESRATRLQREVRSLLNKISPDNEALIIGHLTALDLKEAEDFRIVAKQIIEKALSDPFYSEVYARAIGKLSQSPEYAALLMNPDEATSSSDSESCGSDSSGFLGSSVDSFARVVVHRCKRMFSSFFRKPELLKDDSGEDEEESVKGRERAHAFVRLLGHLYKVHILSAERLQMCIHTLLPPVRDFKGFAKVKHKDSQTAPSWPPKAWILCTVELLHTCGKELTDSALGKDILKSATERLGQWKDLRHNDAQRAFVYPPRIQYKIQDLIEAKARGFPSNPFESEGAPTKSKCRIPVRCLQHTL